jgi:hypothetical protein
MTSVTLCRHLRRSPRALRLRLLKERRRLKRWTLACGSYSTTWLKNWSITGWDRTSDGSKF